MVFLPTKVVAEKLNYTPQHVRRLIKSGTLTAVWGTYNGRQQQLIEWFDGLEKELAKGIRPEKMLFIEKLGISDHSQHFEEWKVWVREGFLLTSRGKRYSKETIGDYEEMLDKFFRTYREVSGNNLIKAWQPLTKSRRYMLYFALMAYARFLVVKKVVGLELVNELKQFKPERNKDVKRTVLEEEEAKSMFDFLNGNTTYGQPRSILNRAIIATMYFAGLRNSELCELRLENVDLLGNASGERTMTFQRKGGDWQTLGIPSSLVPFLEAYLKVRPATETPYLFVGQNGKGFNRRKIALKVQRIAQHLGLEITPHGLRRSFVTISLKKGRPVSEVSWAAGHKHLSTTELYNMTSKRQVVRSMQNW